MFLCAFGIVACGRTAERPAREAPVEACEPPLARLRPGELAPNFVGITAAGDRFDLSSLRSRPVLLHLHTSDVEPSAALVDAKLRDAWPEAGAIGVFVVLVARRGVTALDKVRGGARLAVLADTDGTVAAAYGWFPPYDRSGPRTFVIGPDGVIENVFCAR